MAGRLLTQVDEAVGAVGRDGAYDKQKVFDALHAAEWSRDSAPHRAAQRR